MSQRVCAIASRLHSGDATTLPSEGTSTRGDAARPGLAARARPGMISHGGDNLVHVSLCVLHSQSAVIRVVVFVCDMSALEEAQNVNPQAMSCKTILGRCDAFHFFAVDARIRAG